MLSQKHFAETAFSQFLNHLVFAETAGRVEFLPSGRIECCLVFDELEIVIKVFCAFRIEESQRTNAQYFRYLFEIHFFLRQVQLNRLFLWSPILV